MSLTNYSFSYFAANQLYSDAIICYNPCQGGKEGLIVQEIQGKHADLSIEHPDTLLRILRALSSPLRLDIISSLCSENLSVSELAKKLNAPLSTIALAVRKLEEAGLIHTEERPGQHGTQKICLRALDSVSIDLVPAEKRIGALPLVLSIPIGSYSIAQDIAPTCGMLSEKHPLGALDLPAVFYSLQRFDAQMLWFKHGFLEYRLNAADNPSSDAIDYLEISFEACSEAPLYRSPWPSDISVEINGKRLGTWVCPCDCGGRAGHLTPGWWNLTNTQFGFLTKWRVDHTGSYLDGAYLSDVSIPDLRLEESPYISLRVGVDPGAEHPNGINLFGSRFGDYPQEICMCVGYRV